ncbi:Dynein regulatory complex subunit 5 [Frankliniella fusca]|uniref:Dynein regulatory complex subunit 5 n=1 Tax=Frankliniella fusca TaxID=407009 RepID=A0AAE1L6Q9_9NEOP|nr:Dynein regulatory complex subunit 5 [Frankliniella fusca]
MRVPYTIPRETLRTYECSREARQLAGEYRRRLKADSAEWDRGNAPTLKHLAILALVENFCSRTALDVLPTEDFHRLLETLPTTVPLEVSVPLVPDGVYWRRLAAHTWPETNNVVSGHGGSWRRLVLERRLQQELEAAPPLSPVLDEALRLARLAGRHVRRLRLAQLLHTGPGPGPGPGHPAAAASDLHAALALPGCCWTPDVTHERREPHMLDTELEALKEDLSNVFGCLVNLEELDVMFGMHDFEKNLSEPPNLVKVACCQALGKTLSALPAFRRLRVRRSQLHLEKLAGLLEPMHSSSTLTELDLGSCYLGDKGIQVVSAFLLDQASLRVLRLANNKFGARGASHLAKSLLHKTCPPLVELDVSLNSIGDVGGHNILMAAVPRDHRLPLRDPAEDDHVRDVMLAEEKERQRQAATASEDEPSHEGITIFRGLVQRVTAGELVSSPAPAAAADQDEYFDWEVEPEEQARRPSALLAAVVAEAHQYHREEAQAEEARMEEEQRRREAAAKAAERWEGCPERLQVLGMSACRLGAAAGQAVAVLLAHNRALSKVDLANNHLGQKISLALRSGSREIPDPSIPQYSSSQTRWTPASLFPKMR